MKSLAIILTVFNRKEQTRNCLSSLSLQILPPSLFMDVFLTNDGCTDGTEAMVEELFPQVNIIEGDGTLFWNRGMRKAWQAAADKRKYDYFLWLNDDVELFDGAISILLEAAEKSYDKHIIVGTTVSCKDNSQVTYGGRNKDGKLITPHNKIVECAFFNGNIVLIPNHVFGKIGYNDYVFRHALGDYDYGRRAKKSGVFSFVAPGILGKCDEHANLSIWCNSKYPFIKRLKNFRSPLGQNPEEYFIYDFRHNGFVSACFHYLTIHLRLIAPSFWQKYLSKKS